MGGRSSAGELKLLLARPVQDGWDSGQEEGRLDGRRIAQLIASTWRRARPDIAALLKPDLFREGVDGEAVTWACTRLKKRTEARRILLVISDGCPMDGATQLANDAHSLDNHLKQVVAQQAQSGEVAVFGVGVGLDLSSPPGNGVFRELLGMLARHLRFWFDDLVLAVEGLALVGYDPALAGGVVCVLQPTLAGAYLWLLDVAASTPCLAGHCVGNREWGLRPQTPPPTEMSMVAHNGTAVEVLSRLGIAWLFPPYQTRCRAGGLGVRAQAPFALATEEDRLPRC